jgi:tetraacyldisaccharide-1-P 4'-kinase
LQRAFPDHFRYTESDLKQLAADAKAAGAIALVTTEKDAMNIGDLVVPLKTYWLQIGIEIEREVEFLQRLANAIGITLTI